MQDCRRKLRKGVYNRYSCSSVWNYETSYFYNNFLWKSCHVLPVLICSPNNISKRTSHGLVQHIKHAFTRQRRALDMACIDSSRTPRSLNFSLAHITFPNFSPIINHTWEYKLLVTDNDERESGKWYPATLILFTGCNDLRSRFNPARCTIGFCWTNTPAPLFSHCHFKLLVPPVSIKRHQSPLAGTGNYLPSEQLCPGTSFRWCQSTEI